MEARLERLDELPSAGQVNALAGRLVEIEEGAREKGVIVGVRVVLGLAGGPDVQEFPASTQARPQKLRCPGGADDVSWDPQDPARLRERPNHEPVPGRDDLLVAERRDAPWTGFAESRASPGDGGRGV